MKVYSKGYVSQLVFLNMAINPIEIFSAICPPDFKQFLQRLP